MHPLFVHPLFVSFLGLPPSRLSRGIRAPGGREPCVLEQP
jgi:hypothetical protein